MVIILGKVSVGLLSSRWHILCKASFISQFKLNISNFCKVSPMILFFLNWNKGLWFLFSIKAT